MPLINDSAEGDRYQVWQCMGCGKIDSPQPCIGICQDRRVDFVRAETHDEVRRQRDEAMELVARLAHVTPKEGGWEKTYRALQARARKLLARGGD